MKNRRIHSNDTLVHSCLLCVVSVCCAVGLWLWCDYSLIIHSPSDYHECDWPCQTRLAKWRFMLSVPRKLIICVSRPIPDNYANRWPLNQLSHYSTTLSSTSLSLSSCLPNTLTRPSSDQLVFINHSIDHRVFFSRSTSELLWTSVIGQIFVDW